jgi:CelD/BcsL family acetyltransferase involved in cellulose biosynthesis
VTDVELSTALPRPGPTPSAWSASLDAIILPDFEQGCVEERIWDNLASTAETNSVFQTHAWHRAWWRVFGADYEPLVVVVPGASEPLGIAPLMLERRSARPRVVRFIGDGRSDYCDVLARREDKPRVLKAVFEALSVGSRWDVMYLNNVPASSGTIEPLRDICRQAGYHLMVHQQFVCPTLRIEGQEESALRIYNKPSLRRPYNYFRRAGELVCRTSTTDAEIAPRLEEFFGQHIARWGRTPTPSLFLDPRNREFYRELTTALSGRGWLHFSMIELNGRPLAFHYGFDYNGAILWYKPSFDIAHASRSPGMVLLRHLIGDAIKRQRRELDFTIGDEAFKRRFTNDTRGTVRLRIFRDPSWFSTARSKRVFIDAMKAVSWRSWSRRITRAWRIR